MEQWLNQNSYHGQTQTELKNDYSTFTVENLLVLYKVKRKLKYRLILMMLDRTQVSIVTFQTCRNQRGYVHLIRVILH